jgi:hypothetical protein
MLALEAVTLWQGVCLSLFGSGQASLAWPDWVAAPDVCDGGGKSPAAQFEPGGTRLLLPHPLTHKYTLQ